MAQGPAKRTRSVPESLSKLVNSHFVSPERFYKTVVNSKNSKIDSSDEESEKEEPFVEDDVVECEKSLSSSFSDIRNYFEEKCSNFSKRSSVKNRTRCSQTLKVSRPIAQRLCNVKAKSPRLLVHSTVKVNRDSYRRFIKSIQGRQHKSTMEANTNKNNYHDQQGRNCRAITRSKKCE